MCEICSAPEAKILTTVMAQSSPQAAIIPNESNSLVPILSFEMAIAMTERLLALTTETQEADVRSCKDVKELKYLQLASALEKLEAEL